jgi:hypothetical protein
MIPLRVPELAEEVRVLALELKGLDVDRELAVARLFDGWRDAGLHVPALATFRDELADFDDEAWRRLDLLSRLLRESSQAAELRRVIAAPKVRTAAGRSACFDRFCVREARLLTAELMSKAPFRSEEFVRKWVHVSGAAVAGETPAASAQRLARLDFGNVLKSLEEARRDNEVRIARLKALEEQRRKEAQEAYDRAGRE